MDKSHQISTELWPLIHIKISFPGSGAFIVQLFEGVHTRKGWYGIEDW